MYIYISSALHYLSAKDGDTYKLEDMISLNAKLFS